MMTMRNRVWPLCLAAFLFLAAVQAAFFPFGAAAETAPVAEATPLPADAESASPYRIVLTAPGGWSSGNSAVMKVSVTDINHIGWQKIEYRMNESAWIDCESQFADGKAELALHENGTFTLRVTDPQGHAFEESAQVACIDLAAPVLSASINGTLLEVFVEDDLSGVAGVQVNSMLFTTLTNGALHVELDENMNRFEKLAVRAFDYAGNFSEPVSLDNPHYTRPADPTPMPTATPEPTAKPTGDAGILCQPLQRPGQFADLRSGRSFPYAGADGRTDAGDDHQDGVHHHRPRYALSGRRQQPYAGRAVLRGDQQAVYHAPDEKREHLLPGHRLRQAGR